MILIVNIFSFDCWNILTPPIRVMGKLYPIIDSWMVLLVISMFVDNWKMVCHEMLQSNCFTMFQFVCVSCFIRWFFWPIIFYDSGHNDQYFSLSSPFLSTKTAYDSKILRQRLTTNKVSQRLIRICYSFTSNSGPLTD